MFVIVVINLHRLQWADRWLHKYELQAAGPHRCPRYGSYTGSQWDGLVFLMISCTLHHYILTDWSLCCISFRFKTGLCFHACHCFTKERLWVTGDVLCFILPPLLMTSLQEMKLMLHFSSCWQPGLSALSSSSCQSPTSVTIKSCQSPQMTRLHQQVTQFKLLKLAQSRGNTDFIHF